MEPPIKAFYFSFLKIVRTSIRNNVFYQQNKTHQIERAKHSAVWHKSRRIKSINIFVAYRHVDVKAERIIFSSTKACCVCRADEFRLHKTKKLKKCIHRAEPVGHHCVQSFPPKTLALKFEDVSVIFRKFLLKFNVRGDCKSKMEVSLSRALSCWNIVLIVSWEHSMPYV